jgi:hypothetical protein
VAHPSAIWITWPFGWFHSGPVEVPASTLLFHLQRMMEAGILWQRHSSQQTIYGVNQDVVDRSCDFIKGRSPAAEALLDRVSLHDGYGGPVIIHISGGLPGELRHASAGPMNFVREPGETIAAFKDRAWRAAGLAPVSWRGESLGSCYLI